jgi:hypothetical protein
VNWLQLHLLLVTVPMTGLALGLALLVYGQLRGRAAARRLGLAVLIGGSLVGLLAFAAGRRAEAQANALPGVEPARVERHAGGAEAARIALVVLAAASIGVLLVRRESAALPWLAGGIAVFALVAIVLVARAALLGSEIRHPETRGAHSDPAPPEPRGPGG